MAKTPKKVGLHREEIKAAVRMRGKTLEALSVDNGLYKGACGLALLRPFFSAELVIAEFLDLSPRQIWPQRYDENGAYKHPKSKAHHTRRAASRNIQCEAAA